MREKKIPGFVSKDKRISKVLWNAKIKIQHIIKCRLVIPNIHTLSKMAAAEFSSKERWLYPSSFYGCDTWTLLVDTEKKRIQTFEKKCFRRLPYICDCEHKTNDYARSEWANRNLSSPLWCVGSWHGLATPPVITASARHGPRWTQAGTARQKLGRQHQRVDGMIMPTTVYSGGGFLFCL